MATGLRIFHFLELRSWGAICKKVNKYSLRVRVDYALVQMPSTAIEKAGTLDSEKVKQVFLTHEFKGTVMGDVKYGADGIAFYVNTGNQWWDGRQRFVYPFVKGRWKVTLAPMG